MNKGIPLWLAIDVDILDQSTFSATDYLMPNGLIWDDFAALFKNLAQYPDLLGISIACYNPEKDPNKFFGKKLAQLIIQSLEDRVS